MDWIAINSIAAMLVAFAFGRKFHGVVGRILDVLIFLAGLLSAMPIFILLHTPAVAWLVGVWLVAWQGAYHIGNIEKTKVRYGVLIPWIVIFVVLLMRLANEAKPGNQPLG